MVDRSEGASPSSVVSTVTYSDVAGVGYFIETVTEPSGHIHHRKRPFSYMYDGSNLLECAYISPGNSFMLDICTTYKVQQVNDNVLRLTVVRSTFASHNFDGNDDSGTEGLLSPGTIIELTRK